MAKKRLERFSPVLLILLLTLGLSFLALLLFASEVDFDSAKAQTSRSEEVKHGKGKELAIGVAEALKEGMEIKPPAPDESIRGEPVVSRNILGVEIANEESDREILEDGENAAPSSESPRDSSDEPARQDGDEASATGELLEDISDLRGEISELTE